MNREYSWRFAKSVSDGVVRDTRQQELFEEITSHGSTAVYGALLAYAQTHFKQDGTPYNPGWAKHCFREIYGAWPPPQVRKAVPKALPGFLIEEWVANRKRKRPPPLPLFATMEFILQEERRERASTRNQTRESNQDDER